MSTAQGVVERIDVYGPLFEEMSPSDRSEDKFVARSRADANPWHTDRVTSVDADPKGEMVASGSLDGTAKLWNLRSGKLLRTFPPADPGWVHVVRFSPDGRHLAVGEESGMVRIWDTRTYELLREFRAAKRVVEDLAFNPTSPLLVTADRNASRLRIFDWRRGQLLHKFNAEGSVKTVSFSPDGRYVLAGGSLYNEMFSDDERPTGFIKVWDLKYGKLVQSLLPYDENTMDAVFSPDGQFIASSGIMDMPEDLRSKTLSVTHWRSRQTLHLKRARFFGSFDALAYMPDGTALVAWQQYMKHSSGADSWLVVLSPVDGELLGALPMEKTIVRSLQVQSNGPGVVVGKDHGALEFWDLESEKMVWEAVRPIQ